MDGQLTPRSRLWGGGRPGRACGRGGYTQERSGGGEVTPRKSLGEGCRHLRDHRSMCGGKNKAIKISVNDCIKHRASQSSEPRRPLTSTMLLGVKILKICKKNVNAKKKPMK